MEKKDKTTEGLRFNTETKRYRSETIAIEEEHSTATWVSLGKYLFHFSPGLAYEEEKAAKILSMLLMSGCYHVICSGIW